MQLINSRLNSEKNKKLLNLTGAEKIRVYQKPDKKKVYVFTAEFFNRKYHFDKVKDLFDFMRRGRISLIYRDK